MAKLKDGFYKQTAESIGSDSYVLLAGGGSKLVSDFATASGGQANSAKILANYFSGRPANCDLLWADGGLRHFLATSTMTTSKPPSDAHVLHFSWDNSKWESLLALSSNPRLFIRSLNGANWGNWVTLLGSNNYTDYVYNKLNIDSIINTTQSYIRPSGYVTSSTANLDSYWAKLWEMENIVAENKDITLYIHSAYLNLRGFVHINVIRNSSTAADGTITYNWNIHLKQISGNLPKNRFRLYYNNTSGLNNSGKVLLWCNVNLRYGVYNCQLISATPRVGKESLDNYGTLYSTNFGTVQTLPDDSYIELTDANPITDYYWANVKVSDSSSTTTSPTFATATATTSITTPLVSSTGRLTLNATSTGLDLKFNNDNTKSVILNGTAFKPFDASDNKLTLGSTVAKWSTIYGYTGDFVTKINTPRIDGYDTSGVYLVLKSTPTAVGSLGGAIGIGVSPNNYGMFLWGDGSGYGHIQVGRKDGTNTAYLLKLLEFEGNVNIGSPNLSPAKLNIGGSLFLDTSDATLKIYSGKTTDAKDDGFIAMLTCIDQLDGETHSYAPNYPNREAILLQPRGGKVAIGTTPQGSAKLTVSGNIDITNTAGNVDTGVVVTGSTYTIKFAIGSGNINRGIYDTTNSVWILYKDATTTYIPSWINKGNSTTPVYFDSTGKPIACTAYSSASVNSASKLTTARTIAISEGAVGTPTSFNGTANISIPVTSVKEAYLSWGGKNHLASFGPIDASLVGCLGANRFDCLPAECITIEYSRDAGATWIDYGATDSNKINLVSLSLTQPIFYLGKKDADTTLTKDFRLRVIINSKASNNNGVYSTLNKFIIYVGNSTASYLNKCTIKARTLANYASNTNTWVTIVSDVRVDGWSDYNVINTTGVTTYGNRDDQYREILFEFKIEAPPTSGYGFALLKLFAFGGVGWQTPSNIAKHGHLYNYDSTQKAIFPAKVQASEFIGSLNGNATTASKLGSSTLGGTYQPIYLNSGSATAGTSYAKAIKTITRSGTTFTYTCIDGTTGTFTQQDNNTDTKNTAGSTNTSSKIFLIGATSQAANPQTYSHDTAYVGTDGCLYSNSTKVSVDGHNHYHIAVSDTRSVNNGPYNSAYNLGAVSWHLKQNSTIGVTGESTYSGMLMLSPWGDSSSGAEHHLAFGTNGGIYHRYGASTMSTWSKLAYKSDIPTKTSQLTNDSGFITSRGYLGTTAIQASSAAQAVAGITTLNMSNTLTITGGGMKVTGAAYFGGGTTYYFGSTGNVNCNTLTAASTTILKGSFLLWNSTNSYISFYNNGKTSSNLVALIHGMAGYNTTSATYTSGTNIYFRIFSSAVNGTTISTAGYYDYIFPNVPQGLTARTVHTIFTTQQSSYTLNGTGGATGDVSLTFWRGSNASWLLLNTGGNLRFKYNYYNGKANDTYKDALVLNYDTGKVCSPTGFYEESDERLKDFYNDVEVDLEKLTQLPKKYFRWKRDPLELNIGTSAQEVQKLYPELVTQNDEGILSVDYAKLSIIALKGIDLLYKEIKELRYRIEQLENK